MVNNLEMLVDEANDFKTIRTAVADAAGVSLGLWLSYLFVLFYLLIAAGGVTHRDLFLENQVKLPFLNVDLPLKGFFWLGPALFLIVHAYVLLHFAMLAGKVRAFNTELQNPDLGENVRTRLRWQLPNNVFVQFLAGPGEVRHGAMGLLLWLIVSISLMIGPVALLVFFELQFLPFHHELITWSERLAVVLDLGLLWILWPAVVRGGEIRPSWRDMRSGTSLGRICVSLLLLMLVFGVATFPGEWLETVFPYFPFRQMLVAGEIDETTSRPNSFWTNRLVLSGFDAVDHTKSDTAAKIAAAPVTFSLRGRHLERAVLIDANLPRVDFTEANLEGASLIRAHLQGAWFRGAVLVGAQFDNAQLQGTEFYQARLQGASLDKAQLQGVSLAGAQLQGAWLAGAQLQGASLASADLRHASLEGADLRGANLYRARLQGVSFAGAKLDGASLLEAFVWRTDFRKATADAPWVRIDGSLIGSQAPPCEGPPKDACDPTDTLEKLRRIVERYMPGGMARDRMLVRLGPSLDPSEHLQGEKEIQSSWEHLKPSTSLPNTGLEMHLEKLWREIACAVDGAPFVLTGLVNTIDDPVAFRFTAGSLQASKLAGYLLEKECAAAPTIAEVTKMQLVELRGRRSRE